jgi:hypothetical protein
MKMQHAAVTPRQEQVTSRHHSITMVKSARKALQVAIDRAKAVFASKNKVSAECMDRGNITKATPAASTTENIISKNDFGSNVGPSSTYSTISCYVNINAGSHCP